MKNLKRCTNNYVMVISCVKRFSKPALAVDHPVNQVLSFSRYVLGKRRMPCNAFVYFANFRSCKLF